MCATAVTCVIVLFLNTLSVVGMLPVAERAFLMEEVFRTGGNFTEHVRQQTQQLTYTVT